MKAHNLTPSQSISITVNGELRQLATQTSIADLLTLLNLPVRGIAVEVNGSLIPFEQHAGHHLNADDQVEVASLAGGG